MDCVVERDRILPLESYGQALEQECCFPVVLCHSWVNSMAVSCHVPAVSIANS